MDTEPESPKLRLKPREYFEAKVAFLEDLIAKEKKTNRHADNDKEVEYAQRRMREYSADRSALLVQIDEIDADKKNSTSSREPAKPKRDGGKSSKDKARSSKDKNLTSPEETDEEDKRQKSKKHSEPKPYLESEAQTKSKAKKSSKTAPKQLTDMVAHFPSLSNKFSDDLAVNMAISFQSMLFTWKWKEITWMLRIRKATRDEFGSRARWKRNPRWLMALLAKQIAFMWGHLRSLRQTMNNSKHLYLMGGEVPIVEESEEEAPRRRRGRREA